MNRLIADVSRLLLRDLAGFQREVAAFPDDATLWQVVPGVTNSAGNLAWHVAGNLQHFVGAGLGQTGYARNREFEFGRRSGTRAEVIDELQRASGVVARVLAALPDEVRDGMYPADLPQGLKVPTRFFLLQLAIHAGFHLGQAGYLRRVLTGDTASTGPVPVIP